MFNREEGQELLEGPVQFVQQYVDMPNYKLKVNGASVKVSLFLTIFLDNMMFKNKFALYRFVNQVWVTVSQLELWMDRGHSHSSRERQPGISSGTSLHPSFVHRQRSKLIVKLQSPC